MRIALPAALALAATLCAQAPSEPAPREPAASAPALAAPAGPPRELATLLEPLRVQADLPGLAGAILQHDQLVALGATGLRKSGEKEPLRAGDTMHLGSCTKAMTATLCGLLVDEGKLEWDRTLGEMLGARAPKLHDSWRAVKLRELLTHTSGAPANAKYEYGDDPFALRTKLLRKLCAEPLPGKPGEFLYSNVGYALAGMCAETAAGEPFEALLRRRLFEPLGMSSAGFGAPGVAGTLSQPRGHRDFGLPIEPGPAGDNSQAIAPAGTVHANLADWARFIALHLAAERGEPRLLKAQTFAELHRPPAGSEYAMGWGVAKREWASGRVLTHSGSNTMWFCVCWLAPERDFAVLVATNQGGAKAEKACDQAAWALIQDQLKTRATAK